MNIFKRFFILFVVALCLAPAVMGAVTFTSTPGDISFCVNTWGFADLNWYVQSDMNGTGDYWIYRNGSLWANGDWYNRSDIDHEVWTSEIGVWNYTVVVNDIDGNVSDTVMVTSEMCCCSFDYDPIIFIVIALFLLTLAEVFSSFMYTILGGVFCLSFAALTTANPWLFWVLSVYCFIRGILYIMGGGEPERLERLSFDRKYD